MARVMLSDDQIRIELSLREMILGPMGSRTILRSAVTEVALETDPLGATRGLRAIVSVGVGHRGHHARGPTRNDSRSSSAAEVHAPEAIVR